MDNDFCKALIENDTPALKKLVNTYLGTIDPKENRNESLKKIKNWLSKFECIDSVVVENQVLASDPPIQRFAVIVKDLSGSPVMRSIGVKLFDNKLTSDLK